MPQPKLGALLDVHHTTVGAMLGILTKGNLIRVVDGTWRYKAGEKPLAKLYAFNLASDAYERPKPRLRVGLGGLASPAPEVTELLVVAANDDTDPAPGDGSGRRRRPGTLAGTFRGNSRQRAQAARTIGVTKAEGGDSN